MTETIYGPPYESDGNCLYLITKDKHGQTRKRLCNFAPYIIEQVTKNDGADCATWITLGGTQENGEVLQPITIRGTELGSFDWLIDRWGADCFLEVTNNVKEHVRVKIKDELEARGIQTAMGKSRWYPTVISHVLKNSFYCGIITYHKEYVPDYTNTKRNMVMHSGKPDGKTLPQE